MSRAEGISKAHDRLKLSKTKLIGILPEEVLKEMQSPGFAQFEIQGPLRLAHFLAQCAHESASFRHIRENLNYSSDALSKLFRKYFPEHDEKDYHRHPKNIANRIYASRMGNGDETSGDGWRYRGRGYIQLTGQNNYRAFFKAIGLDSLTDPDVVATTYPLTSAAWFFTGNKLHLIADKGPGDNIVREITRKVNGGYHGLDDRLRKFKKIHQALT